MSENKSYLRWQNIRISQLGFANNLIIALAIGLIGYTLDFIKAEEFVLTCFQKTAFWIGGTLTLGSIGLGLITVMNRLKDFKLTAQIARKRETENRDGIDSDREKSNKIGNRTWNLFIWQVSTFLAGFILLLIIILIELKDKLI